MRRDGDKRGKKPLYRKVNTKARGVHHNFGGDFKNARKSSKKTDSKMKRGTQRGLDYTPLFKFLLSKVGKEWDDVYKEIQSRVESEEPIWYMVQDANDYFMTGESTYFSTLYVDDGGILQIVNPEIGPESLVPVCPCCTHTFNGHVFNKKYGDETKAKANFDGKIVSRKLVLD
jgi:hypothetical protein